MGRQLILTAAVGLTAGLAGGRLARPRPTVAPPLAAVGAPPPADGGVFYTAGVLGAGQFPLPAGGLPVAEAVQMLRRPADPPVTAVTLVRTTDDGAFSLELDLTQPTGGRPPRVRSGDFLVFRKPAG